MKKIEDCLACRWACWILSCNVVFKKVALKKSEDDLGKIEYVLVEGWKIALKGRLKIVLKKKVEDCFEKEGWWLSYTDYWFSNSAWSWSWKSLEIVLKKLEDILDNNCRKSSLMKTLWKHYWQRLKISLESIVKEC